MGRRAAVFVAEQSRAEQRASAEKRAESGEWPGTESGHKQTDGTGRGGVAQWLSEMLVGRREEHRGAGTVVVQSRASSCYM